MRRPNRMTRREFIAAGRNRRIGHWPRASVRGAISGRGGRAFGGLVQIAGHPRQDRGPGRRREEVPRPHEDQSFPGKRVLVKPNFNTSDETPGSTHNDTLRALLARIREMGAASLAIGDRSGPEPTEQVFDKKGIRAMAGEFDAKLLNFDELGEGGYVKFDAPTSTGRAASSSPGRSSRAIASSRPAASRRTSSAASSRCRSRTPSASCRAKGTATCASSTAPTTRGG